MNMSADTEKHGRDQILIEPCTWKDIEDNGLTVILKSNDGVELRSDLTSSMVIELVDLLLEASKIEEYEYVKD